MTNNSGDASDLAASVAQQPSANDSPGCSSSVYSLSDQLASAEQAAQLQHLSHLTKTLSGEKQFLRAVVDATEDALAAFGAHGQFVLCNHRFETLFSVEASELGGLDESGVRALLRERLNAPSEFFTSAPLPETPDETVLTLRRRVGRPTDASGNDGQVRDERTRARVLRWHSSPLHNGEMPHGRIVVVRDLTREAELDAMKTDFISIVSHELRTPMTSIKGYVDLILDGDTGEINDLQRQFLTTVQRNTRRLVGLVNDMLDISRIESEKIEFDLRPLDLAPIIEHVVETAHPQIIAKQLQIEVEIIPPLGAPRVIGDYDRIIQVLTNLISNAIKYTPAPPASPGLITICARLAQPMAHIEVRDTGIGISADDQSSLFQKFFRAENSATRDVDGTGLGLPISRALVEKMGGELCVQSQVGKGSEFSFSLPLEPETQRRRRAVDPTLPQILVVHEDPKIVDAISGFLSARGCAVTRAYSGPQALRLLHEDSFDAVMTHLLMPHLDGLSIL
ncbi:MAG TPA: ATP-binding protein, partial [Abditibacteriaceae bacterium]